MPTVEDYYDDDTDIPVPSSSFRPRAGLQGQGLQGALLEEISTDDPDDPDVPELDFDLVAEQGRGIYGANATAPPPQSANAKGKLAMRDNDGEMRPSAPAPGMGGGPRIDPNSAMGGFMGDMMKLQQAEEERMERLRKQMGGASIAQDPSKYKMWNSLYPLYFDAKVSSAAGRRVPRKLAMWWPQASHIAQACRALSLPSVLEPDRTHPADWENPGRVKVQFERDGRPLNPIVKNRSQLHQHIGEQLQRLFPDLAFVRAPRVKASKASASGSGSGSKPSTTASGKPSGASTKGKTQKGGKGKSAQASASGSGSGSGKGKGKAKSSSAPSSKPSRPPLRFPSRPPQPGRIPELDERLPLHSPVVQTGVAVAAVKRDIEAEKEAKKKGGAGGAAGLLGGGGGGEGGEEKVKQPKMKRIVVRGKR